MKERTDKFDAAVNQLRKKLGGHNYVKVSDGITRKVATVRHTQGEHVAMSVRVVGGKERISRDPIPAEYKVIPFHN